MTVTGFRQSILRHPGLRIAALGGALAFALTGCGSGTGDDSSFRAGAASGGFSIANASELFTAGYDHIAELYVEPLKISDVGLHAVQALSSLDADFKVVRDADQLRVLQNGIAVQTLRAPGDKDIRGWGLATARVMDVGRSRSEKLRDETAERLYQVAFDGALGDLDRFSRYASAEVARNNRASRDGFYGIGVLIEVRDNIVRVTSVLPDTPAEGAGLKDGDRITHIDGASSAGLPEKSVVSLLRGPLGAPVALTVLRGDAKPFDVSIARGKIVQQTVTWRREPGGIAYFKVTSFNRQTAETLADLYERADREMGRELKGIVLDLRNNPGGLLDQGKEVADLFLTSGRILTTRGRHADSLQVFDSKPGDIARGKPMAVLVNGASASAAEIVAAALQDLGRAVVVGSGSYGKGTVQTVQRLPNDGEITITWAKFYAPSGYALHKIGVLPNICTSRAGFTVAKSLDDLRGGRLDPIALISARRTADSLTEPAQVALAATCPHQVTDAGHDQDLDVARTILADPGLMLRSIRGSAVASAAAETTPLDTAARAAMVRR